MQIEKNTVVSLSYTLKNDNAEGPVIEVAKETDPLVFLYGAGNMLPRFEQNLSNLKKGDAFEFRLESTDAYGEHDPSAIIDLNIDIFKMDGKLDEEMLAIGNMIPMRDSEGHMLQGRVVSVSPTAVKMDFNHPMAGQNLHFTGSILDVRKATDEEISHGHVHGHGGHAH
ncbi:MAG TPA: FKBP-type peptidyl-prolyl cis-trans isomerase [Bacteroidales bacterium]|nr:FKBP-type peptidyl-prolyl cis-trans isomerase [Bacteroidales bacterium]